MRSLERMRGALAMHVPVCATSTGKRGCEKGAVVSDVPMQKGCRLMQLLEA